MFYDEDSRVEEPRDTSLICIAGHVITAHLEEKAEPPNFCSRCGEQTTSVCFECGARIPGDYPHMRGFMTAPPAYCAHCSKPYPWYRAATERAERIVRMQSEIHSLDEATTEALARFAQDVAQDKATPEEASTFGQWFRKKAGLESARAVGGALKEIATSVISEVIVKVMMP
jgi:hypothetical protein